MDYLSGAKIHFVKTENVDDRKKIEFEMKKFSEKLKKSGKVPYLIPIGGSTPLRALGYTLAAKEIKEQSREMRINFSYIFHASSSGGTQAGLEIGKRIFKLNSEIVGIGVSKKDIQGKIFEIAKETINLLDIKNFVSIKKKDIKVDMNYVGKDYGIKTKECVESVDLLAKKEAILLDYVYTGKAMSGLIDYARKGKFSQDEKYIIYSYRWKYSIVCLSVTPH